MNPMTLLAVLFGTATIILAYAVVVYRDYAKQMRKAHSDLLIATYDTSIYVDELELHNAYLGSEVTRLNDLRAAGHMFLPRYRVQSEKLTITGRGIP